MINSGRCGIKDAEMYPGGSTLREFETLVGYLANKILFTVLIYILYICFYHY